MDALSFKEERLARVRDLAAIIANGGVWTKEEALEAADLAEVKQLLAGIDGKSDLVQRLKPQIETLRKKV